MIQNHPYFISVLVGLPALAMTYLVSPIMQAWLRQRMSKTTVEEAAALAAVKAKGDPMDVYRELLASREREVTAMREQAMKFLQECAKCREMNVKAIDANTQSILLVVEDLKGLNGAIKDVAEEARTARDKICEHFDGRLANIGSSLDRIAGHIFSDGGA